MPQIKINGSFLKKIEKRERMMMLAGKAHRGFLIGAVVSMCKSLVCSLTQIYAELKVPCLRKSIFKELRGDQEGIMYN